MNYRGRGALSGTLLLLASASPSLGQGMPPAIQEIWDLEETYWHYVQDGNVQDYIALWHDDFVGWPCESQEPQRKDTIGDWVQAIKDNGWKVRYELVPKAVQRFEGTAVVHYSARILYDYGDGETEGDDTWWKFTHTWSKTGNSWWIIGGMCGLLMPEAPLAGP